MKLFHCLECLVHYGEMAHRNEVHRLVEGLPFQDEHCFLDESYRLGEDCCLDGDDCQDVEVLDA